MCRDVGVVCKSGVPEKDVLDKKDGQWINKKLKKIPDRGDEGSQKLELKCKSQSENFDEIDFVVELLEGSYRGSIVE